MYLISIHLSQNDLKSTFAARDKEQKQHKALEKVKDRHPSDRHQIVSSEAIDGILDALRAMQ